ncbi:hypothetical protein LY78DRAFT_661126 [Colletotrichum sublineola]|nr:hypothetical protein LY78DRAFT_661126 [Colletotrichum sublineola]
MLPPCFFPARCSQPWPLLPHRYKASCRDLIYPAGWLLLTQPAESATVSPALSRSSLPQRQIGRCPPGPEAFSEHGPVCQKQSQG